jgi:hypothetical protein
VVGLYLLGPNYYARIYNFSLLIYSYVNIIESFSSSCIAVMLWITEPLVTLGLYTWVNSLYPRS